MRAFFFLISLQFCFLQTVLSQSETVIETPADNGTKSDVKQGDDGPIRQWSHPEGYQGNPDKKLKLYKKKPASRKYKKRKTKRSFGFKKK